MSLSLMLLILAGSGCHLAGETNQILPVVYLGWDENEQNQLFSYTAGDAPQAITDVDGGVHDYALSPDGRFVVYSTLSADGTNELRMTDRVGSMDRLLLNCSTGECTYPVWAQDGRRLIYEKRARDDSGATGSSQLWWLDSETGETKPVLAEEGVGETGARFAPDGQWLSYVSAQHEGVILHNLIDGRSRFIADEVGVPAAWSPTSDQLIVPNLDLVIIHGDDGEDHLEHTHDYQTATHLFRLDVANDEIRNISGDRPVEDSVPAWSPDGEWVAFGRRFPGTAAGRQLWLMRPDGSEQRPLADDPVFNHGPPRWSPDGRYLLFQRFMVGDSEGYPSIWILELDSGQIDELVAKAMQPSWLVEGIGN